MTSAQLQALKTELTTDPRGYGYAALLAASNWNGVRDALNLARAGIVIRRSNIVARELLEAIDLRDLLASPAGVVNITLAGSWLESITQVGDGLIRLLDGAGANTRVKQNLDRLLGNTQGSQTRLNALAVRDGSRAEELWGESFAVTDGEVETAWRLP
jgi:hypothetical protein